VVELGEYALEPLRKDEEFILYRGQHRSPKDVTPSSILLLAPVSIRPAPETVKKIEHEYSFRSELDATWAVRPLALSRHNERTMLVLEDPGGEPLNRLIHGPMRMRQFLRIATGFGGKQPVAQAWSDPQGPEASQCARESHHRHSLAHGLWDRIAPSA
jgi:hypothetical protein